MATRDELEIMNYGGDYLTGSYYNNLVRRERYLEQVSGSTAATTYTTVDTVDVSAETTLYAYSVEVQLGITMGTSYPDAVDTGYAQLFITFTDASTETTLLDNWISSPYESTSLFYTYNGYINYTKRIESIEIQLKCNNGNGNISLTTGTGVYDSGESNRIWTYNPNSYLKLE